MLRKAQIIGLLALTSLAGCQGKDEKSGKTIAPVTEENLQGYWSTSFITAGSTAASFNYDLNQSVLVFRGKRMAMASAKVPGLHCADEREFTLGSDNVLTTPATENCPAKVLQLKAAAYAPNRMEIVDENTSYVFERTFKNNVEEIISNSFQNQDDVGSALASFFAPAPDASVVESYLNDLRAQLKNTQVRLSDPTALKNGYAVIAGGVVFQSKTELASDVTFCTATQSKDSEPVESNLQALVQFNALLPTVKDNIWTYVLTRDYQQYADLGLTPEEIEALVNKNYKGTFSQSDWRLNTVLIETKSLHIQCEKPLTKGLLSWEEIETALGSVIQLQSGE